MTEAGELSHLHDRLQQEGVCMSCVIDLPEPHGCSDCKNTGYKNGEHPEVGPLKAEITRLTEEVAGLKAMLVFEPHEDNNIWTAEARAAVNVVEEKYGIRVCSMQHLETWVDGCAVYESEITRLTNLLATLSESGDQADAAPPEPDWIPWHGGTCPFPRGTRVDLQFIGNTEHLDVESHAWLWSRVIAYRLVTP